MATTWDFTTNEGTRTDDVQTETDLVNAIHEMSSMYDHNPALDGDTGGTGGACCKDGQCADDMAGEDIEFPLYEHGSHDKNMDYTASHQPSAKNQSHSIQRPEVGRDPLITSTALSSFLGVSSQNEYAIRAAGERTRKTFLPLVSTVPPAIISKMEFVPSSMAVSLGIGTDDIPVPEAVRVESLNIIMHAASLLNSVVTKCAMYVNTLVNAHHEQLQEHPNRRGYPQRPTAADYFPMLTQLYSTPMFTQSAVLNVPLAREAFKWVNIARTDDPLDEMRKSGIVGGERGVETPATLKTHENNAAEMVQ